MAQTFLIFDFGTDEEAAQLARHRIEGWKQGFRLGNKLQFKFERESPETREGAVAKDETQRKGMKKESEENEPVRLLVRLNFSNHEKHLAQSWVERIPADDAFKSVKSKVIHHNESAFEKTSELFDSLS
ncbi:MAG TPA: hypothetical protein VJN90_04400 [Candidatus Acidoferrales bacterium]|nr:hypothetical protein [Candidatus Acidoferrales bacterium]